MAHMGIRTFVMGNVILADFRPLYRSGFEAAHCAGIASGGGLVGPPNEILGGDLERVAKSDEVLGPDALDHILLPLPDQSPSHADDLGKLRDR
jgi:hypothetical protein